MPFELFSILLRMHFELKKICIFIIIFLFSLADMNTYKYTNRVIFVASDIEEPHTGDISMYSTLIVTHSVCLYLRTLLKFFLCR